MTFEDTAEATAEKMTLTYATEKTLTSLTQAEKRTILATTTSRDIVTVAATPGPGQFTALSLFVLINRDTTDIVYVGLRTTGGDTAYIGVLPGRAFVLGDALVDTNVTGAAIVLPMAAWNSISIIASANTPEVDYMIVG